LTVAVNGRHVETNCSFFLKYGLLLLLLAGKRGPWHNKWHHSSANCRSSQGELKYKVPEVGGRTSLPPVCARAIQIGELTAIPKTPTSFFIFGQGQGGSTGANIDRWINQMQQPDGRLSNEKAKSRNDDRLTD